MGRVLDFPEDKTQLIMEEKLGLLMKTELPGKVIDSTMYFIMTYYVKVLFSVVVAIV